MKNEYQTILKESKNLSGKLGVLEIITNAFDGKERTMNSIKQLVTEIKEIGFSLEDEIDYFKENLDELTETKEEFLQKNIKYMMNQINMHEDSVFEILNKPERQIQHKFNHKTLMEFLKPIVSERNNAPVNDVDVMMYIERLIVEDIRRNKPVL
ncbi:hypothetical protein [Marinilactibacillus psychrotolerans]|uniref:hypothetical protein n=1 Tax=Marinilactibacillus psychrotolerans TaxID=191770 RepID=UPI00388B0A85